MGAPDPRSSLRLLQHIPGVELETTREFWSFRPPIKSAPHLDNLRTDWPRACDIDRFLLAALEARGLSPVADASRPRLLRRVTFDLIGLPPAPEELDAFLSDDSHNAFAKGQVDRLLLASPHFGERLRARHWLDVANRLRGVEREN